MKDISCSQSPEQSCLEDFLVHTAFSEGSRSFFSSLICSVLEEALAIGIRSRIDLSSNIGVLRFDVFYLGINPNQKKSSILVPSQEMNPRNSGGSGIPV